MSGTQSSLDSEMDNQRTRRSSEREPADSLIGEFNVIGGWLPSLTFALVARRHTPLYEIKTRHCTIRHGQRW